MTAIEQLSKLAAQTGSTVQLAAPLASHTTFKIGGPCDILIEPKDEDALCGILAFCREQEIPVCAIGNGSNLLIPDEGMDGAVLLIGSGLGKIDVHSDGTVVCGAGASLKKLCMAAYDRALTGLEFAYGIPGSCGGAAFMNAGAYGGEMKDVLISCTHVTPAGEHGVLSGDALGLSYRHSAYKENGCVITSLALKLLPGNREQIKERMDELMQRRRDKQPLEYPSAGSIFKRPPGHFAGTLIEQCGLKGAQIGGAQVSEKHAGFIVNAGGATCADVLNLIEHIQKTVLAQTGVTLECEVRAMPGRRNHL